MIRSLIRKNDEDCEPLVMKDCLLREDSQEMESVTHPLIRIQIPVIVQTRQKRNKAEPHWRTERVVEDGELPIVSNFYTLMKHAAFFTCNACIEQVRTDDECWHVGSAVKSGNVELSSCPCDLPAVRSECDRGHSLQQTVKKCEIQETRANSHPQGKKTIAGK